MRMSIPIASLFFLSLNAADDSPVSPKAFIKQLTEREKISTTTFYDDTFILNEFHNSSSRYEGSGIKNLLQACGVGEYAAYLVRLSYSTVLSPEDKLDRALTNIPPFKKADKRTNQNRVSECLKKIEDGSFYPLVRILLSSLVTDIEMIVDIKGRGRCLATMVVRDDVPMITKFLHLGVSPNKCHLYDRSALSYCKSRATAELLIANKADTVCLGEVLARELKSQLRNVGNEKNKDFLCCLADTVQLNESNGFGWHFMQVIAQALPSQVDSGQLGVCVRELLEHRFECDDQTKKEIIVLAGKKSAETRRGLQNIFEECQDPGKNIKG